MKKITLIPQKKDDKRDKSNLLPAGHLAGNGPCGTCCNTTRDSNGLYCNRKSRYVDPNEWHFCHNE